jgi:hypothetical protein
VWSAGQRGDLPKDAEAARPVADVLGAAREGLKRLAARAKEARTLAESLQAKLPEDKE